MAAAIEAQFDAVMHQSLAAHSLAHARALSRSTVPCSRTPARTRSSTCLRLCVSITIDSMPSGGAGARAEARRPCADDADLSAAFPGIWHPSDSLQTIAIPCPTPMHMVHSAYRPPVRCSCRTAVREQPRPARPQRMAERDCAAVRDSRAPHRPASPVRAAPPALAPRMLRSVRSGPFGRARSPVRASTFCDGGHRSQAHHARRDSSHGAPHDPRPRS